MSEQLNHIDGDRFQVLLNAEEQYSLWPAMKPVPDGWKQVGPIGSKVECLAYVEAHWLDMRPKSVRQAMTMPARGHEPSGA